MSSQARPAAHVARKVFMNHGGDCCPRRSRSRRWKPEPAEPQQARADHDQWQVVRTHRGVRPSRSLADDDDERKCRRAGVVDSRACGEVDHAELVQPSAVLAIEVEDPVRDREVDDDRPQRGEDQPGRVLRAIGDRAGDEGRP